MSRSEKSVQYEAETLKTNETLDVEKVTKLAIPYGKSSNKVHLNGEEQQSTSSHQEVSDNEDSSEETEASSNVTRITTRARVTYELDRFKRNAMLIFAQIRSDPPKRSCRFEKTTMEDLNMLVNTFIKFRFEVDQCIDMTCSQLENKCQEFFQRDFCQCGAVVVAVLTYEGKTGELLAYDGPFSETIILRHLTSDLNRTLLDKPKIFITEANRSLGLSDTISLPIDEYQDVLGLHLAVVMSDGLYSPQLRPLSLLCDNINKMADTDDLLTISKKTIEDIVKKYVFIEIVELQNTLTKELILART